MIECTCPGIIFDNARKNGLYCHLCNDITRKMSLTLTPDELLNNEPKHEVY
jgi:hypothetical protein